MVEFLTGADLWSNILGGVVAALLIALIAFLWDRRRHRILGELIEVMRRAIKHRNIGEHQSFSSEKDWIQQAIAIEEQAVSTAKKLSPTAGSLIEWLDRVPPYSPTSEVEKYVSFLSIIIVRIRGLMEKYS